MTNRPRRPRKPPAPGPVRALTRAGAALAALLAVTVAAGAGHLRSDLGGGDRAVGVARHPDGQNAAFTTASSAAWSEPATVRGCGAVGGPQVVFPSQSPTMPTGPGAIVWASGGCGARTASPASSTPGLGVAAIGPNDDAAPASAASIAGWSGAGLEAVGGSLGRITAAVPLGDPAAPSAGGAAVLQGRATRPLAAPARFASQRPALAVARAYLGDVAIATLVQGPAIAVRLERYFSPRFAPARLIPIPPGPVTALTVTMDYRADVLVAWQQDGAIYAHMLRASQRRDPTQRVGASAPDPQLRALVSDNDHGMIAWASTDESTRSQVRTRLFLDLSAAGVRFGAPQTLASFADSGRVCLSAACLALVRLSTENVMLAWTDVEHGHYVVRAAPAVFAITRPTTRISGAGGQAVLAGLAAGSTGEAVALWEVAPARIEGVDAPHAELWATRAYLGRHDRIRFGAPQLVAARGPNLAPSVAVNPADDRAVAAWLTTRGRGTIEYAVGLGPGGYSRHAPAAVAVAPGQGTHWLRIALAITAAAAAVTLLGLGLRRRRRLRGA